MPTELELIALDTEFTLYLTFVKRLVLDLPNCADRARAALWLKKLRSIQEPDQMKLRNEHLKLFLFALHRRSLVGIFEKKPPKEELETFHDGLTLMEMTRELIEITEKMQTEQKKEGEEGFGVCPLPPCRTNISYDLKEYAAFQDIPKFGAHCYYAVSNEPIQLWTKPAGNSFPGTGEIPNQFEWELSMSKLTDHILEKEAEIDAQIEAQKQAEMGVVFEEPEVKEEHTELLVVPCEGAATTNFKWKADSKLVIYQNYDFSDVGVAEDLEGQGLHQLETDERALSFLDDSLPGRQRLVVRTPFYDGLPPDLSERRYHGVVEEVPEIIEGEYLDYTKFCTLNALSATDEDEYKAFVNGDNDSSIPCCPCDNLSDLMQDYMSSQSQIDNNGDNGFDYNTNMNTSNTNTNASSGWPQTNPGLCSNMMSRLQMSQNESTNQWLNQNPVTSLQSQPAMCNHHSFEQNRPPPSPTHQGDIIYSSFQNNMLPRQNYMQGQSISKSNHLQNNIKHSLSQSCQSGFR